VPRNKLTVSSFENNYNVDSTVPHGVKTLPTYSKGLARVYGMQVSFPTESHYVNDLTNSVFGKSLHNFPKSRRSLARDGVSKSCWSHQSFGQPKTSSGNKQQSLHGIL